MKRRWKILFLAVLAAGLLFLYDRHPIRLKEILNWKPDDLYLAALVLLLAFAVKSVLVFVPILIPQILAGHIYPRDIALTINLLGLVIVMTVPYWIGRKMGSNKIEGLLRKHPKLKGIVNIGQENELAMCFMLRSCAVPPADIVTMYLGAAGTPFHANLIGGVLGSFPVMVLTTFLGERIRDPSSPEFWKALGLNILWIVLSALGFYLLKRFTQKEGTA